VLGRSPPSYSGPGDCAQQPGMDLPPSGVQAPYQHAPEGALRLESTPFYLYLPGARRRITEELPEAKLVVIVRDPIDRAYSNWIHLWVDGLEPI
jgi:Sulfotransferase family